LIGDQTNRSDCIWNSGIDLIVKTQKKKDFQVIIAFGHSTFITSQLLFVPMNMVLKWYLPCRTFSKCQSYSNESRLSKRTCTYKIDADNQLHNCVFGAHCLSRWWCYKYTCKITAEKNDWTAIALITLHRNVKVNYLKSVGLLARQLFNSEKALFETRRLTDK